MWTTRRKLLGAATAFPVALSVPRAGMADAGDPAPTRGATFERFHFGESEITVLVDSTFETDSPRDFFAIDQSYDSFDSASSAAFIPTDRATFYFLPVLVRRRTSVVLFDTGQGSGVVPAMTEAGVAPEEVTHVVITHMHNDHIGGLVTDGAPTFKNAEHITGETEMTYWAANPNDNIERSILILRDRFTLVGEGAEIVPGIVGMEAFGHSPGHMIWRIDEAEGSFLILADTATHHVWSLAHPDWQVTFDMDNTTAAATRRRMLDMAAVERMPILGYHLPFPGVGYVAAEGEGFLYVPATYQFS